MFSVIIPTYNRAAIIGVTIRSVLNQSYGKFELIIVNDGSTDNTEEIVNSFSDPRIRYYAKTNGERSAARNFGGGKANGRYLIFLDSDDRMQLNHLQRIHEYLAKHDFIPRFLFSGFRLVNEQGIPASEYRPSGIFDHRLLIYGNHLGCSPVTIERELFQRHQFHDHPDMIVFEDWDLWLRVISEERLHCIPAASIDILNHKGRSVLNCTNEQLVRKVEYFRARAGREIPAIAGSVKSARRLAMGLYSYVALHLAMTGTHRGSAISYLLKAMLLDPWLVTRKRFYAIVKRMIL